MNTGQGLRHTHTHTQGPWAGLCWSCFAVFALVHRVLNQPVESAVQSEGTISLMRCGRKSHSVLCSQLLSEYSCTVGSADALEGSFALLNTNCHISTCCSSAPSERITSSSACWKPGEVHYVHQLHLSRSPPAGVTVLHSDQTSLLTFNKIVNHTLVFKG